MASLVRRGKTYYLQYRMVVSRIFRFLVYPPERDSTA